MRRSRKEVVFRRQTQSINKNPTLFQKTSNFCIFSLSPTPQLNNVVAQRVYAYGGRIVIVVISGVDKANAYCGRSVRQ
jgi:outer membrane PBP1 activator LpoA protein